VVSRDSVRLAFLIAALNDLNIMAYDVGNAYLKAPCHKKVWFVAGAEFGLQQGMVVKVVQALYGLKSSGALWWAMFNLSLIDMAFQSTIADPDVYRQANAKPCWLKYYEYLLAYVDDVLIVLHSPKLHLEKIKESYELNLSSVGPPMQYLGRMLNKLQDPGTILDANIGPSQHTSIYAMQFKMWNYSCKKKDGV
jgi:Reverse transcriptase (RNA-dependent DNA polymerase)